MWRLCPPVSAGADANASRRGCFKSVLEAGDQLYYPQYWRHETLTLDVRAASLSRLLLTPANAAAFARRWQQHCDKGLEVDHGKYQRLCEAMAPCVRRLSEMY